MQELFAQVEETTGQPVAEVNDERVWEVLIQATEFERNRQQGTIAPDLVLHGEDYYFRELVDALNSYLDDLFEDSDYNIDGTPK
ncbi:hypothetical protein ABGB09_29635 [Streptomyces sp. B8F3]|uniref:hypothetical protein n=1 Tax=Streptomyces sp. B8F3 TaxID=3153573 RepID=UPI00325DDAAF